MKTLLVLVMLACCRALVGQTPVPAPSGYQMNPAAQKQAERQALRDAKKREAEDRAYRQLLIDYLDRIARQRR